MQCEGEIRDITLNWKTRRAQVTLSLDADPSDVEKLTGKKLSVELKQYRQRRSLDANAYYWVLVSKISAALDTSAAQVHNRMLRRYGVPEIVGGKLVYMIIPDTDEAAQTAEESETYHIKPTAQVKLGRDGKLYRTYILMRGSHDYDAKEMSALINGIVSEAKEIGIETMTPAQIEDMMRTYKQNHKKVEK